VINTATIPVDATPVSIAFSPDGSVVYTANQDGSTLSVINTASNAVTRSGASMNAGPTALAAVPTRT